MLRQILRPTDSRLVLELPAEFIGQAIEVLAFPVEDAPKPPADTAQSTDLLSVASLLRERLGATGGNGKLAPGNHGVCRNARHARVREPLASLHAAVGRTIRMKYLTL